MVNCSALRLKLLAHGWQPIPATGKAPHINGWQNLEITPEVISGWESGRSKKTNTGIRTGLVVGVDLDILDEPLSLKLAALARNMLGPCTLERVGREPKRLLVYRTDTPQPKQTVSHGDHKIELLGQGQQFIAYGIHPDTGRPYRWVAGAEPATCAVSALTSVTPAQLQHYRLAAGIMIDVPLALLQPARQTEARPTGSPELLSWAQRRDLKRALRRLDPDNYDNWYRVAIALNTVRDGQTIFMEWARRSPKFNSTENDFKFSNVGGQYAHWRNIFSWSRKAGRGG